MGRKEELTHIVDRYGITTYTGNETTAFVINSCDKEKVLEAIKNTGVTFRKFDEVKDLAAEVVAEYALEEVYYEEQQDYDRDTQTMKPPLAFQVENRERYVKDYSVNPKEFINDEAGYFIDCAAQMIEDLRPSKEEKEFPSAIELINKKDGKEL